MILPPVMAAVRLMDALRIADEVLMLTGGGQGFLPIRTNWSTADSSAW